MFAEAFACAGVLRLPVAGGVDGGTVHLQPQWQWQEGGPVLTVEPESEVLSRVLSLDAPGRVEEIARMLGGVEITATTRRHAEEMLAAG